MATCGDDGCNGVCGVCRPDQLCKSGQCEALPAGGTANIVVDTGAPTNAIHPEIYGLAFATKAQLTELNIPLNRNGGNSSTRYNWQLDTHNLASDWYFENVGDRGEGTFGAADYVSTDDVLVRDSLAAGATTLITVPTIGWTAKARKTDHPYDCGYPKTEYANQASFDQWDTNCGNGKDSAGNGIVAAAADALNTSKQVGPDFANGRVTHLMSSFDATYGSRVHFYALDNEMMLWNRTHSDVHPAAVSYSEVWQKTLDFAPAIRAADPKAFILGYGTWGAADTMSSGVSGEDKTYGMPLMEWYLKQLADYDQTNNERLVDCVDLHFYPQQSSSIASAVLNSPRTLWDASYTDESWLNDVFGEPVQLFPRVRAWIQKRYPGTQICMSEYNFFPDDPSSLLVQAEVLGIFGREDLRAAAWWTVPWNNGNKQAPYWAFMIFRNYDGVGGTFGEQGLATATTVAGVSAFGAARTSDQKVTVMAVNKNATVTPVTLQLQNSTATTVAVYSVKVGDAAITSGNDIAAMSSMFSATLAASSVTLFVSK
jgi:hypothetical protein